MNQPIAKKLVNALISDAKMSPAAKVVAKAANDDSVQPVIGLMSKAMGGLWVGGSLMLFADRIVFQPNMVNQWVHDGDCSVEIELRDVVDVQVRSGFVTNVIDITTTERTLSARCYGAAAFAEQIRTRSSGRSKAA